jgi:hypothetical protein
MRDEGMKCTMLDNNDHVNEEDFLGLSGGALPSITIFPCSFSSGYFADKFQCALCMMKICIYLAEQCATGLLGGANNAFLEGRFPFGSNITLMYFCSISRLSGGWVCQRLISSMFRILGWTNTLLR